MPYSLVWENLAQRRRTLIPKGFRVRHRLNQKEETALTPGCLVMLSSSTDCRNLDSVEEAKDMQRSDSEHLLIVKESLHKLNTLKYVHMSWGNTTASVKKKQNKHKVFFVLIKHCKTYPTSKISHHCMPILIEQNIMARGNTNIISNDPS